MKLRSKMLCLMLAVSVALTAVGCGAGKKKNDSQPPAKTQEVQNTKDNVIGEGQTTFVLTVVDGDGKETDYEVHTDKKTVGDALLDVDFIAGEEGEYGLYVKTVNGITADYDVDQTYWSFYIGDEYAVTGVDATDIEEGVTYTLKVEKE